MADQRLGQSDAVMELMPVDIAQVRDQQPPLRLADLLLKLSPGGMPDLDWPLGDRSFARALRSPAGARPDRSESQQRTSAKKVPGDRKLRASASLINASRPSSRLTGETHHRVIAGTVVADDQLGALHETAIFSASPNRNPFGSECNFDSVAA